MAVMERITAMGQLVCLVFEEVDVAADQTDAQMKVTDATASPANDGYLMPFGGVIVAISCLLTAAASAGSLTVGPTVDDTEKGDLRQTITTQTEKYGVTSRELIQFAAGDVIGAEITTDASWNGTGSDLSVLVWAIVFAEGI